MNKATKINWKDDSKNLTKLYPRVPDEDGGDMPFEAGTIFNFFEQADDQFDVSLIHRHSTCLTLTGNTDRSFGCQ